MCMPTFTLYVRRDFEATLEAFKKVCEREGNSASEKFEKWVRDYVSAHGDGNPQTLLDFAGEVKTLPRWKTCRHSSQNLRHGEFFCYLKSQFKLPEACTRCERYEV